MYETDAIAPAVTTMSIFGAASLSWILVALIAAVALSILIVRFSRPRHAEELRARQTAPVHSAPAHSHVLVGERA